MKFFFLFVFVCCPLPRNNYTNSQSNCRETNACGGCPLTTTQNDCVELTQESEHPTSISKCEEIDRDEEIESKKDYNNLVI